ncbi:MAG: hypothetical protein H7Z71_05620 [Moraxellaceae bacterium]|nr:hypothetical protein [Pseudobdellovibrionaceae bacterium]
MKRRTLIKFAGLFPLYTLFNTAQAIANTENSFKLKAFIEKPKPLFEALVGNETFSKLVIIAGRPSMGKSAVMLNLLDEVSEFKEYKSLFFSIELSKAKALQRWQSLQSDVGIKSLNAMYRSQQDTAIGFSSFSNGLAEIDDSYTLSVQDLRKRVELYKAQQSTLKYVFVDYIQLLNSEQKFPNRLLEVEDILKNLKTMSTDLNLVVIVASQINLGMESRLDKRPLPTDLREIRDFRSIDKLVLIYRKKYYDENADDTIRFTLFENEKNLSHGLFKRADVWFANFNSENHQITGLKS